MPLILFFLLWGCTGSRTVPEVRLQPDPDKLIFEEAEAMFRQQSYQEALTAYSQYLNRFPGGSSTDLALKRIATIHGYLGDKKAKLENCRRLTAEFPDSPYAPDADYEIMMALYEDGKSREVILRASAIIKESNNKDLLLRTYLILGDTYVSLGSAVDAVFFYNLAYSTADASEKENIIGKIKDIATLLNQKDVDLLYRELDRESIKSDLLYQIALMEYERENNEEAKKIFLQFLESSPHHKNAERVKTLVEEIDRKTTFRRELIGCLLPLSGHYEAFGNRALKAVQLARDRFNFTSGKPDLQLVVRDTESDPKTIKHLMKELDERGVALIIGPLVTSEQAAVEAQKREIPIITLTQKTGITEIGEYAFRNFLTPDMQVEALVSCAIDQFGIERFAILYPDEDYGRTFMNLFKDRAEYYGAEVVEVEPYSPDQTDFSAPIKKMARISADLEKKVSAPHRRHIKAKSGQQKKDVVVSDFDAIFIPDQSSKAALIAPQLTYWGVDNVLLMGTNLWHSDQLIATAKNYVQEAILVDIYYAQSSEKAVQNFIRAFEKVYGQQPGFMEGLAYDTAMIAFQTAADPEVRSRKGVRDHLLKTLNFDGTTGLTSFNASGEGQKKLYLLQIQGNNFVELD